MDDGAGHSMAADQQHYSSTTGFSYGDGQTLTSTEAAFNVDMPAPTATTTPTQEEVYWMILIPSGQFSATYYGTNTVILRDAI